jgi:transcription elongation factor SPT6
MYLKDKRIGDLTQTDQFLNIVKAETEGSLTVAITLPPDVMSGFESKLRNAFSSDGFSESVKLWNAERLLVVNEALDKHLIPAGTKWAREYVTLQEEDFLASVAGQCLLNVRYYVTGTAQSNGILEN